MEIKGRVESVVGFPWLLVVHSSFEEFNAIVVLGIVRESMRPLQTVRNKEHIRLKLISLVCINNDVIYTRTTMLLVCANTIVVRCNTNSSNLNTETLLHLHHHHHHLLLLLLLLHWWENIVDPMHHCICHMI